MKFLHISDLHIGKRLDGYSLCSDQRYILSLIAKTAEERKADAVIIAGDIYDTSRPSAEAVAIFDDFITELSRKKINVYAVSGNHDSGERVDYGKRIFEKNGLYMCGVYEGELEKARFKDEYGYVNIYMLPFITHYDVNRFIDNEEEKAKDYDSALKYVLENADIDYSERNILAAHQLIINGGRMPVISESERIIIGGLDGISSQSFEKFDYTALGHIHSKQKMNKNAEVWYCGAPLKYSFSKEDDDKKIILVTLEEKGKVFLEDIPLVPLRKMTVVEDTFENMIKGEKSDDYIKAVVTDTEPIQDVFSRLKNVYPNLCGVEYANRKNLFIKSVTYEELKEKSDVELFADFYEKVNGFKADSEALKIVKELLAD